MFYYLKTEKIVNSQPAVSCSGFGLRGGGFQLPSSNNKLQASKQQANKIITLFVVLSLLACSLGGCGGGGWWQ